MPDQTSAVGMERKLAAIFSMDVAGYSRLMGEDEEATIRTLTTYRAVVAGAVPHMIAGRKK
jgi:adenylate cyclase